jgi:hypothetical protein
MWYFPFSEIFYSAAFAALLLKNHPRNADDLGATGLQLCPHKPQTQRESRCMVYGDGVWCVIFLIFSQQASFLRKKFCEKLDV